MSIPVIAFFNNRDGVGNTWMVYHLSWMFADRGLRVVAADLDPQANLTAAFLEEDRLEEYMPGNGHPLTVFGAILPLISGTGDIAEAHIEPIDENLGLIPGDMALSTFEDQLSEVWPKCMDSDERSFRVTSALWRVMQRAGEQHNANVIMVDMGPNLGAINRAALIASDFVVIPLGPDLFSIQGLQNLGPAVRRWRSDWEDRVSRKPVIDFQMPSGSIMPLGYVVIRKSIRLDRPVKAFDRWVARIPGAYKESVLDETPDASVTIDTDPNCIAKLKDYRSLMPLAQEARKPMFYLKPADGALGAHSYAVTEVYKDFQMVARKIALKAGLGDVP